MNHSIRNANLGSSRSRRLPATAAVLAGLATIWACPGTAWATPGNWEPSHDEWAGDWLDFCGVPGLTIHEAGEADNLTRFPVRGPDHLPVERDRVEFTDTYTNTATGESVHQFGAWRGYEQKVTHNGDGTLTVSIAAQRDETYTKDGQIIGRETGLFSFTQLMDDAGTPTDRSDDEFITYFDVKNTGLNADFCPMMLNAIG